MARVSLVLKRVFRTQITSERDLFGYVLRTSGVCAAIALAVDVVNQMVFFISWSEALRSWAITIVLAFGIAVVVSRAIGKSHLDLYRAKQVVEKLSRTDALTGLPNRRALLEVAETPDAMVLVIVDIDRFKRVNDTYGHIAGDAVIRRIAEVMTRELGSLGQLGRLGGEEFALLTSGIDREVLSDRLTAFRDAVAGTPVIVGDTAVKVTISAGVALRGQGDNFAQLYSAADQALYLAKAAGRNRVTFAESIGVPGNGSTAPEAEDGLRSVA
jgi:diguanylate cyclase (GGDEF)-like protein